MEEGRGSIVLGRDQIGGAFILRFGRRQQEHHPPELWPPERRPLSLLIAMRWFGLLSFTVTRCVLWMDSAIRD
jgi:hypothetical protein